MTDHWHALRIEGRDTPLPAIISSPPVESAQAATELVLARLERLVAELGELGDEAAVNLEDIRRDLAPPYTDFVLFLGGGLTFAAHPCLSEAKSPECIDTTRRVGLEVLQIAAAERDLETSEHACPIHGSHEPEPLTGFYL